MAQVTASRSGLPLPADAAFKLGCVALGHNPLPTSGSVRDGPNTHFGSLDWPLRGNQSQLLRWKRQYSEPQMAAIIAMTIK